MVTDNGIEIHQVRPYHTRYPAVNVKVYSLGCTVSDVVEKFACSEKQAEKALEFAFDSACRSFWDYWQDTKGDYENGLSGSLDYAYFPGYTVTAHCEGRSGGWLTIQGLPPVEEWEDELIDQWNKFKQAVQEDVKFQVSKESFLESIGSNEWYLPYSEQYNYVDTANGTLCLATVKADVAAYAKEKFGFVPTLP